MYFKLISRKIRCKKKSMMRYSGLFVFLGILFLQIKSIGQEIEIYVSNEEHEVLSEDITGDTLFYEMEYGVTHDFYFNFKNVSDSPLNYHMDLEIIEQEEAAWGYIIAYQSFYNDFVYEMLPIDFFDTPTFTYFYLDYELEKDSSSFFRLGYGQEEPGLSHYRIYLLEGESLEKIDSLDLVFYQWEGLSLEEQKTNLNISIYPNPGNGICNIEVNRETKISVSNAVGQIVYEDKILPGISTIDLTSLEKGLYTVTFFDPKSNEYLVTRKWVIN